MFYKKLKPTFHLQAIVDSYFFWESDTASFFEIETPPNGKNAIVFNYGDPYQVVQNEQIIKPAADFVTGQATSGYQLQLSGKIAMAGIIFKPTALSKLLGGSAEKFTDHRIDLDNFLPASEIQHLLEKLYLAPVISEKYKVLEGFVSEFIHGKDLNTDYVDHAVDIILSQKGNIQVKNLADQIHICPRQFRRKFFHRVGITPKEYIRIQRLGQVCYQLINQASIDWHDVIYHSGYYDQSHFIKDFMRFIGRNPSSYYKNNKELSNIL